MTTAHWKTDFREQLVDRNDLHMHPFSSIIANYQELLKQLTTLKQQSSIQSKQLKSLSEENSALRNENSGLRSEGKVPTYSKDHEEKVFQLQEELTAAYRARAEDKQQLLDTGDEVKRLKAEILRKEEEIEEHIQTQESLKDEMASLRDELVKKEAAIALLKDEHSAIKAAYDANEEKIQNLERENKDIVQRMMDLKMEQAEALNEVLEMQNKLQKEHAELQRQKQRYQSQSAAGGGNAKDGKQQQQQQQQQQQGGDDFVEFGSSSVASGDNPIGEGMALTTAMIHGGQSEQQSGRGRITVDPPSQVLVKKRLDHQINCVQFSNDGSRMVIGCTDKTVKVWNAKTGNLLHSLYGSTEGVTSVAISSDARHVLGCSTDSTCRMWDLSHGNRLMHTLTGHTKKIYGVDFSSDNAKGVTGSHDRTMKIWDLSRGMTVKTLTSTCKSSVNDLEISVSDMIASAHVDGNIRIHDLRSQKMIHDIEKAHAQPVTSIHFSRDNRLLLSCGRDSMIRVWDVRTYGKLHTFIHPDFRNNMNTNKVVFSPSSEFISAGGSDGSIYLWSMREESLVRQLYKNGHNNSITGTAWSPDGLTIASVSLDKQLILWN